MGWRALSPQARLRDYCNQEYIRLLFEEHVAGIHQHWDRLWMLLTFEVWLRMFEHGALWSPRRSEVEAAVDVTDVTRHCYG